jgi:hypothetical protein
MSGDPFLCPNETQLLEEKQNCQRKTGQKGNGSDTFSLSEEHGATAHAAALPRYRHHTEIRFAHPNEKHLLEKNRIANEKQEKKEERTVGQVFALSGTWCHSSCSCFATVPPSHIAGVSKMSGNPFLSPQRKTTA